MGIPEKKADQKFTYADYLSWPDDERWEIIEGTAWNMSPAPSRYHQKISQFLSMSIGNFLDKNPCEIYAAPFNVVIPSEGENKEQSTNVVQPDISVVCDKNKLKDFGCLGGPDLVIEILSPYTGKKDLDEKFHLYERSGVREYWIIDPGNRYVRIFSLGEDGKYDTGLLTEKSGHAVSKVLEGFSVDLELMFMD